MTSAVFLPESVNPILIPWHRKEKRLNPCEFSLKNVHMVQRS
jgi:hypothetical protein